MVSATGIDSSVDPFYLGGPTPSKPKPRGGPDSKRSDQIVNLARTHLKRRLIAFEGERPQKHQ